MLDLHVLRHVVQELALLAHHLRLGMLTGSHHVHVARVARLGDVILMPAAREGVLVRSVAGGRWLVHWDAHVSLVVRRMWRWVGRRGAVAAHLHGL